MKHLGLIYFALGLGKIDCFGSSYIDCVLAKWFPHLGKAYLSSSEASVHATTYLLKIRIEMF